MKDLTAAVGGGEIIEIGKLIKAPDSKDIYIIYQNIKYESGETKTET